MKRICFVVQRYGKEIVGGAESLCMQYVNELQKFYEIEVVTSCAVDYDTWENFYDEGRTVIDGAPVYRFASKHPRRPEKIGPLTEAVYNHPNNSMALGKRWLKEVGPYCPGMLKHIKKNKKRYDLFVFVGYHYFNSTFGMPLAPEKAVFLPTAHDEPPIRKCNYFKHLFSLPRAFVFLTEDEQEFVTQFFHIHNDVPRIVAGAWVELPAADDFAPVVDGDYIVYAGRIDQTKNCDVLLEHFLAYKRHTNSDIKLVLMGKAHMELPKDGSILYTGFVSEEQKFSILKGASAFVMPSQNESLSIGTLEAMACGTPVLVNGACGVLRAHINQSKAGLCYSDGHAFIEQLDYLLQNREAARAMGLRGIQYVQENYAKEMIIGKLRGLLDQL